jgi:hypothetical protein
MEASSPGRTRVLELFSQDCDTMSAGVHFAFIR